MIKDITLGQYVPGNSFIHRLDPRVKIVFSMFYIVLLFISGNFQGYGFIIAFTFLMIFVSKINIKFIFNGLKPIIILILITTVLNLFMFPGTHLIFKFWMLRIYREGLINSIIIVVRLTFLIVGTSLLTFTTSPIQLTDGLEKLLNPLKKVKLPVHELAMMMSIALRFIPTLIDETDKIMKAQMARGTDIESGNIVQRAKSLIPILVPLFISSFRRADELAMAMESRCYRGGEGRTRMNELKLKKDDYVACIFIVMFTAISIFLALI